MQKREEILLKDTWNLDTLFSSIEKWKEELHHVRQEIDSNCPSITSLQSKLDTKENILLVLDRYFDFSLQIERLYVFAHLKHDQDTKNEQNKTLFNEALMAYHQFKNLTCFIEPEILQLKESILKEWIQDPLLEKYSWYLTTLIDQKKHVLKNEQEHLLSLSSMALQTPYKAFGALNNADLKFKPVQGKDKKKQELTHGSYQRFLKSHDRSLRKQAFLSMHASYKDHENSLVELLYGQVHNHLFHAKARKFDSSLAAALFPNQIKESIYRNLIEVTNEKMEALHRYIALRKQWLDLDKIHAYDLYAPITKEIDFSITYEEASDLITRALQPLGEEYQGVLRSGLVKERWVDIYENEGKRSGAYSSGCYGSYPYILMNFQGTFSDLMTLSHEAGHSMHTFYSNKNQPYHYASYPIFLAEIASTFHEELTYQTCLKETKDPEKKKYILCQKIDGMRATFFRQTMFAEFELLIHEMVEKNIPLTPQDLASRYLELNKKYFGPAFTLDDALRYELLRIPHFYYNFYVYQYATGIAAAHLFAKKVVEEGKKDAYLHFISSGSRHYPLDILKESEIDLTSKEVFVHFIDEFQRCVEELHSLVK